MKITKTSLIALISTLGIEIYLLNFLLVGWFHIDFYNRSYLLLRTNVTLFLVDLVCLFWLLDFSKNKKSNITKAWKSDVNYQLKTLFLPMQIIKYCLLVYFLQERITAYQTYLYYLIGLLILTTLIFYLILRMLPQKENLAKKFKKIRKKSPSLKFVLIDGDNIPSSLSYELDYKVLPNRLYLNYANELPYFPKETQEYIINNTVAIIHENEIRDIINTNRPIYHVVNVANAIEYTENMLLIDETDFVSYKTYQQKCDMISGNECDANEYLASLNVIYQYLFNNRFDCFKFENKNEYLKNIYNEAFLCQSVYQSVLMMYGYITTVGKLVQFYLYAKYENAIIYDKSIFKDNPSNWSNAILEYVCQKENDYLYQKLMVEKVTLSKKENDLIKVYLSNILNEKITGDFLTFCGLIELYIDFRNRIEAHGIISEENVFAVWNLMIFFAEKFNQFFDISNLDIVCENDNLFISYPDEDKVNMKSYVISHNGNLYFISKYTKALYTYTDYFHGKKTTKKQEN